MLLSTVNIKTPSSRRRANARASWFAFSALSARPRVDSAEPTEHPGQCRHPVIDGRADAPGVHVDVSLGSGRTGHDRCGRRKLIGIADDHVDPVAADLRLEPIRAALGDQATRVDDADLVGELVRLVEVLGGQHDCGPVAHERTDRGPHLVPAARVEAGGRLVGEQHARREDEAGGEVQAPAHAPGVLLHRLAAGVGEAEVLEELIGPQLRLAAPEMIEAAEHHQVLAPAEDLVDGRVLPDQPDPPANLARLAHDVEPGNLGPLSIGPKQGGEDPHRGRLAISLGQPLGPDRHGRFVHPLVPVITRYTVRSLNSMIPYGIRSLSRG